MYTSRAEGGNTVYLSYSGLANDPRFTGQGLVDTRVRITNDVKEACQADGVTSVQTVPIQGEGGQELKFLPGFQSLSSMFVGCSNLVDMSLTWFDTAAVTDMGAMFMNCSALTSLDLSNFDTSAVTDMSSMFRGCSALTALDLSNFDTSKVDDTTYMFENCSSLTSLDLSSFDTSAVTAMIDMFNGCSSLTSLDLSSFDASKVAHMHGMFTGFPGDVVILFESSPNPMPSDWANGIDGYYKLDGTQLGNTTTPPESRLMLFKEPPSKQAVTWVQLLKTVSDLRRKTGATQAEVNALRHRITKLERA